MKYSAALIVPALMVLLTATASAEWQADASDKRQQKAASAVAKIRSNIGNARRFWVWRRDRQRHYCRR